MTDVRKQKMIEGMKLLKEACESGSLCGHDECPFWRHCIGSNDKPWEWLDSFLSDTD